MTKDEIEELVKPTLKIDRVISLSKDARKYIVDYIYYLQNGNAEFKQLLDTLKPHLKIEHDSTCLTNEQYELLREWLINDK